MPLRDRVQAVDRSSPLPLWAQMQEDLRRRLTAGAFAERFPTMGRRCRQPVRSMNRQATAPRNGQ